jgi:hypothetical protein
MLSDGVKDRLEQGVMRVWVGSGRFDSFMMQVERVSMT